jgi:hypothetical protein
MVESTAETTLAATGVGHALPVPTEPAAPPAVGETRLIVTTIAGI